MGVKSQWNLASWYVALQVPAFVTTSEPSVALGVRGPKGTYLGTGQVRTMFMWEPGGEYMYKSISMERAKLLPCGAWRLWDIPSPVYHPICPFQNLCQRLEEAVGSHWKARG